MTKCVYCGNKATTDDHIPSKSILSACKKNTKPIIVPCCNPCNQSFSKDEDYFRILITMTRYNRSISATHLFDTATTKSLKSNQVLLRKLLKKMSLVDLYSKNDIYLGKKL